MLTAHENYFGPDHEADGYLDSAILPYDIDLSQLSDYDLSPLPRSAPQEAAENDVFLHLESKVQSYARAFPRVFDRARGTELWDVHGRRFLDFLAGALTTANGIIAAVFISC